MGNLWKSIIITLALSNATAAAEVFNLAVPDDAYPPYIVVNDQNEVTGGLLIDPLKNALTELGIQLNIHMVPIERSRLMLISDELDGTMHSPSWTEEAEPFLWLDLGIWVEDLLYFKSNEVTPPLSLQQLDRAEVVVHKGYIYPELESLFQQNKVKRLDRYSSAEMILTLAAAPKDSQRFMIMDKNVWQWHQQQAPNNLQLQASSFNVGCASLQLRLANNKRMQRLQPLIQSRINRLPASRSNACYKNKHSAAEIN